MKANENYSCQTPIPSQIYSVDPVDQNAPLLGKPSSIYGVVRALAFRERMAASTGQRLRILFGEAGRRSVPWGCLWYEAGGKIYQFGSGISNYPEARGIGGKGISSQGERMLVQGLSGVMAVNDGDFKWVQDELDVTPLLTPEAIESIQKVLETMASRPLTEVIYQSRMRAQRLGVPIRANSYNCTSFIGDQIGQRVGIELPEYMPLELFGRLKSLVEVEPILSSNVLDSELQQVLNLTEQSIQAALQSWLGDEFLLSGLTKFSAPFPKDLRWAQFAKKVI